MNRTIGKRREDHDIESTTDESHNMLEDMNGNVPTELIHGTGYPSFLGSDQALSGCNMIVA